VLGVTIRCVLIRKLLQPADKFVGLFIRNKDAGELSWRIAKCGLNNQEIDACAPEV